MATSQATIDFILDQVSLAGHVYARKMFGEYALYCDEKVVALVCDNTLYVKITAEGKSFVGTLYEEGEAYPGAKPSMVIGGDLIEQREWITQLIRMTAEFLPKKKLKK